ncbi:transcription elongation factor GreB [Hahella chejuensis KCTC 2396]|uniref:Transcription elongation factor GreB n=1 Tax=Hahella chejuensis (strain KCTC 2396) TaxID=349521 RepID=Q2SPD6_HAHCH|nr:transcription elongation factor GreB [Hahella chejuensis]ABC27488.1 transcription elongation factor GreB [Hahella chejuensis KCTC 2396]
MSRYRPPGPPKARYITSEGERVLREELQYLWKVKRPEVTKAVSEAAAMGDRSENAEYIYGKKQLREIDRRVRYLTKRLDELKVVDRPPEDQSRVYFGAWVTLEDEEGDEHRYRIVGSDEIGAQKGYISVDSPMAKALLKKQVDDEAIVTTPSGRKSYFVIEIEYCGA